jgi:hypothetical protein
MCLVKSDLSALRGSGGLFWERLESALCRGDARSHAQYHAQSAFTQRKSHAAAVITTAVLHIIAQSARAGTGLSPKICRRATGWLRLGLSGVVWCSARRSPPHRSLHYRHAVGHAVTQLLRRRAVVPWSSPGEPRGPPYTLPPVDLCSRSLLDCPSVLQCAHDLIRVSLARPVITTPCLLRRPFQPHSTALPLWI